MSDKFKNIDDLFKDKFQDFELDPPEHIWENVKQEIQSDNDGGSGKSGLKGGIAGVTIILLLVGLFSVYQLNFDAQGVQTESDLLAGEQVLNDLEETNQDLLAVNYKNPSESQKQEEKTKNQKKESRKQKIQQSRFDLNVDTPSAIGKKSLVVNKTQPQLKPQYVNYKSAVSSTDNKNSDRPSLNENDFILTPGDDSQLLALNTDKYIPQHQESNSQDKELHIDDQNITQENEVDNSVAPGAGKNPEIVSDYGRKNSWAFGLYFTPEMNFYPENDILNNQSYSIDVQAMYKFSGYFLQSGLGISMTSDEGNYKIDYNKYLGSYENVYNVTFDTSGNQVTPIYHTETVKVYDSINHINISPTKSKYSYLQIPLLFGYGSESKRFGWFVKGGPSISILINENISDYTMSDAKILNVDSEMPGRIKTNWQFVLSGGLSYRITNNLSFAVEPMFRYYIKSAYENNLNTTKRPYSIGLRMGLLVNF